MIDGGIDEEDDDEEIERRNLGMIEEESQHSTQRRHTDEDTKLLAQKSGKLNKSSPRGGLPSKASGPLQPSPRGSMNTPKGGIQAPSPRELQQLENQILKEQTTSPRLAQPNENAIPEEDAEHDEDEHPQMRSARKPAADEQ